MPARGEASGAVAESCRNYKMLRAPRSCDVMTGMRRRDFMPTLGTAFTAAALAQTPAPQPKGKLKQTVTRGVFGRGMSLEDTCKIAADAGIVGYDLIGPAD